MPEPSNSVEVELKCRLAPHLAPRLRRHPIVRNFRLARGQTRNLTTTYYDTPDFDLHRAGVALRVRHGGARRTQTVKLSGEMAVVRSRPEIDWFIDGPDPDLSKVVDVHPVFSDPEIIERIDSVFETRIRRTVWTLGTQDNSRVALCLDIGSVVAGDMHEEICEVELELVSGRPAALYDLALALHQDLDIRISRLNKSERGYRLYGQESGAPVRAEPVILDPETPATEAFSRFARSCLKQIVGNEAAVHEGTDPEGVHQMRVGIRRLRSTMSLFRPLLSVEAANSLKESLSWLGRGLGRARDADVFIADILTPVARAFPDQAGLDVLMALAGDRKVAAYESVRDVLDDPRYTRLLLISGLWLERPEAFLAESCLPEPPPTVAEFGRGILDRRHRKMIKRGRHIESLSVPEKHQLRILVKKQRYACEFFAGMFNNRRTKPYLKCLRRLQNQLGYLNDAAVAEETLRAFLAGRGDVDPETHHAAGMVLGWHAAGVAHGVQALNQSWKALADCKKFW